LIDNLERERRAGTGHHQRQANRGRQRVFFIPGVFVRRQIASVTQSKLSVRRHDDNDADGHQLSAPEL